MDEFKNLNGNGELFNDNPDNNKVKIDFGSIESTESGIALEEKFGAAQEFDFPVDSVEAPVEEQIEDFGNIEFAEEAMPQEPIDPAPQIPVQQMPAQQMPVQQMPVQQMPVQQMPAQPAPAKKKKKAKKSVEEKKAKRAKRNKNFGIFIRIFVITILSVVTLWTVAYTVDHVLAAQGYAPVFVIEKTKYDIIYLSDENEILRSNGYDENELMYAYSYECLGYKIQHVYDEKCNPEVDFVWAWEKGAVDELYDRGELFKP